MSKLTASIAAATLAASLGAYAALPTGAAPFQVVVPNLKSGLEFTLKGFYLQPTNSDLDYATSSITTTVDDATNTATNVSTLDPGYNLGFAIGLGYVFPNSGNDAQINWTHFNHTDNDSAPFVNALNGSITVITRAGNSYEFDGGTGNSSNDVKYDAVDLDMGQYLSIGTRLQTRLFAGLRYAQIKSDLTDTYMGHSGFATTFVSYNEVDSFNSKFTGIGPRFGVDATYHVGNCFGVVGHVAAALLVGRVDTSSGATYSSSGESTSSFSTTADNQTRVVPAFDAKLGIDYSWPINNDASSFTVEAGYQATQYVDAIDRVTTGDLAGVRTTSGVGFNGPYLSLNYKM